MSNEEALTKGVERDCVPQWLGGGRLVVEGGGSLSDFGLVGETRGLASFFFR